EWKRGGLRPTQPREDWTATRLDGRLDRSITNPIQKEVLGANPSSSWSKLTGPFGEWNSMKPRAHSSPDRTTTLSREQTLDLDQGPNSQAPALLAAEYSIAAVSKLTGISCHTLRVWERRYRYPVPARSPAGHRRYDRGQIQMLCLLARLNGIYGRPIGELI